MKQVNNYRKLLNKIKKLQKKVYSKVLRQYAELRSFGKEYNSLDISNYEIEAEGISELNHFFRQRGTRTLKKVFSIERKEGKEFNELINLLEEISLITPDQKNHQRYINRITEKIKIQNNLLIRFFAVDGILFQMIKNYGLNVSVLEILRLVEKVKKNALIPCISTLQDLDKFFVHEQNIIEIIYKINTFEINVNNYLKGNLIAANQIIMDTSFLFESLKEKNANDKEDLTLGLKNSRMTKIYPKEVRFEKKFKENMKSFFITLNDENFKEKNISISNKNMNEIHRYWVRTDKYNRSSQYERNKFLNESADIKILNLALTYVSENLSGNVVILSNDADIFQTIQQGKRSRRVEIRKKWNRIHCVRITGAVLHQVA